MSNWCYWKEDIGPANWGKHFPEASGQRQSPINIKRSDVLFDPRLKGGNFEFHYVPEDCYELWNKGFTWSIKVRPEGHSYINATHLPWEYTLIDVHCHWGCDSKCGSEHLIDGRAYAAEIHIVHMNKKYSRFDEALRNGDGLAVLGIFLEEGDHENKALTTLVDHIKSAQYKEDKIVLPKGFDLKELIPNDVHFYTYDGSLTTPPCSECVMWTVFRTPIQISKSQMQMFRELHGVCKNELKSGCCSTVPTNDLKIVNNYRPPQPLHGRRVRSSFEQ